jgi:hypothetical protein
VTRLVTVETLPLGLLGKTKHGVGPPFALLGCLFLVEDPQVPHDVDHWSCLEFVTILLTRGLVLRHENEEAAR